MNEENKTNVETAKTGPAVKRRPRILRLSSWLPVFILFLAFLAGAVPLWLKSSRLGAELSNAQRELRRDRIQLTLASAALDARRGNYEAARKSMVNFFGSLAGELGRGSGSVVRKEAFYDLQPLLDERDEVITLLARSDPASAERLAEAYAVLRDALGPDDGSSRAEAGGPDISMAGGVENQKKR